MFMQPQVTVYQLWYVAEEEDGSQTLYPQGCAPEAYSETRLGYGSRLSAPGYMDCTDWCVFPTAQEAYEGVETAYRCWDEDPADAEEWESLKSACAAH